MPSSTDVEAIELDSVSSRDSQVDLSASHDDHNRIGYVAGRLEIFRLNATNHDAQMQSQASIFRFSSSNNARVISQVITALKGTSNEPHWINLIRPSSLMEKEISQIFLGGHKFPSANHDIPQMMSGPHLIVDGRQFIWTQSPIWFRGERAMRWSSLQQAFITLIVCVPTPSYPGTVITVFSGQQAIADECSHMFVRHISDHHNNLGPIESSVWLITFVLMSVIAEQFDFVFQSVGTLGPLKSNPNVPSLDDLPHILDQSRNLSSTDRFLTGLEELVSFLLAVRELLTTKYGSVQQNDFIIQRREQLVELEARRLRNKVEREQLLCRTYSAQLEHIVQMAISYNASSITLRLDQSRKATERLTKVGIIVGILTTVISPLSLLTSYFGMNVSAFETGANVSLYDFWKICIPLFLLVSIVSVFLSMWIFTTRS